MRGNPSYLMSLASMADARIQRNRHHDLMRNQPRKEVQARAVPEVQASSSTPSEGDRPLTPLTPLTPVNNVVRYIPSEAIAFYVPIFAGAFGDLVPGDGIPMHQLD